MSPALGRLKKIVDYGSPVAALGLGILSQVYARHTIAFAPKAVALLVVAWTLGAAIGEWLPPPTPHEPHERWRHFLRTAAALLTISLFRNVIFFLVPIWMASATATSANMAAPLALVAAGLLACFPTVFQELVLDRPRVRTLWSSGVLFAALVPATAVEATTSPRVSAALAAGVAWIVASLVTSRAALETWRGRRELVLAAAVVALFCAAVAPLLPPVPVACRASATGTALRNRQIEGEAKRFAAGTKRVYAWFAVHVPPGYRQGIRFAWFHDGRPVGHDVSREIIGGRDLGFRTAAFTSAPRAGSWRVDLLTDASQLIARERFVVE